MDSKSFNYMMHRRSTTLLVGANGAGKSRFLVEIGKHAVSEGVKVFAISNTVFDRLKDIRGGKRISATQGNRLPGTLIKEALRNAADLRDGFRAFRQIGKTLDYCGYPPTIGIQVRLKLKSFPLDLHDRMTSLQFPTEVGRRLVEVIQIIFDRIRPEIEWLHFEGYSHEISKSYDLTQIIFWERELKKLGVIYSVDLFLRKGELALPLTSASSGQLSMLSTFVFLAVQDLEGPGWVLIDEPENSLHPQWQKEYVDQLSQVLQYRGLSIVIATHAPILVSGATLGPSDVEIYRMKDGEVQTVFHSKDKESVEQVLWEVFQTVTPANHFVSSKLVAELERVEQGLTSASSVKDLLSHMQRGAYDNEQRNFLADVAKLAEQVESGRGRFEPDELGRE